ncbi:TPA: VWA domain-containing protein [Pseudomonas aeruginosa]|uniref:Putative phage inhibition, colicin resistance and tellurite resistance protein n=1 Tax=Pseudomonas aeruginosa TaxID=287 RepID=A0A7S6G5C7_PSEAI|nr:MULTISPECIES: VWA domain-containing protein [Pseudomonas]MCP8473305.1 VWA domain-containing protein [Pseudomonas triclosanedens]MCP8479282.1 VWA domain-containing protein [Pseudomonas triclosanedens]EKD1544904.1 VWA domain-containing protein [Pseudomonas aeruginosa]EKV8097564.1 VWA domain-containing protein [Pseudomonas aeruginosa]EKW6731143.1 VWA domain-containing protein [Pseudomonas aeruginosa]
MQISQGQRIPLSNLIQGQSLSLAIQINSPHTVDLACFGLDAAGKLSDDRYMIFFNQPISPCGSLKQAGAEFSLSLAGLPSSIDRLVFTAAIDGAGAMRDIQSSSFLVKDPTGQIVATCPFAGNTFAGEKAIMVADVYRKDGQWRLASNLQGFNEGLSALVKHFGGEVADDAAPASSPAPAPAQATISLEKKVAAAAPQLISLAKKAQVSLEKAKLTHVRARVALVLDASGSMNSQYSKGRVQEVVNRLLPLAVHFDDDGSIDCWAFAAKPQKLSEITLSNYQDFINTDNYGWRDWNVGSRINDEPRVMEQVINYYLNDGDRSPVYVLFISDGGVHENRKITKLMTEAAKLPLYWQFVGLGGHGYGILEKLDDMKGRVVDNCGFFALDDLHQVSEEQLYDQLMEEFPSWIKEASAKGIIA